MAPPLQFVGVVAVEMLWLDTPVAMIAGIARIVDGALAKPLRMQDLTDLLTSLAEKPTG